MLLANQKGRPPTRGLHLELLRNRGCQSLQEALYCRVGVLVFNFVGATLILAMNLICEGWGMRSIKFGFLVTLALVTLTSVISSYSQELPQYGQGVDTSQELLGGSYEYQLLKQTTAVWSDGRGDVILERQLRNVSIVNFSSVTWYFDWPGGDYSEIRAWDSSGPLSYSTSMSGTRITITVYFRETVPIGQSYKFSLAITIGNMASKSGDSWRAYWGTYPVFPIEEFVKGVTFPSNAIIESASPPPTTQQSNYLEWREFNTPSGWSHVIDVFYTLSDDISVPLFLQTASPWEDDPYASYPPDGINTIRKWGCNTTSAAMILNYWEQQQQLPSQTDPGKLNTWFRENNGYNAGNGVRYPAIATYAKAHGISLYYLDYIEGRNDTLLNDFLLSGNPVILGVDGHFVVATGKTTINGVPTYEINDPIFGQTTLYEKWGNSYKSIILLSSTPADQETLQVSAHSPIELVIVDPLGRKTGFDPTTNTTWDQIPNASYVLETLAPDGGQGQEDSLESKVAFIDAPLEGEYRIEVHGTGQGEYEINSFASDWSGDVSFVAHHGTAQNGSYDEFTIVYDSELGLYPYRVLLPVLSK